MSRYFIEDETLTDIADAIRLKRDIVTEITPEDMPLQVALIESGGGGATIGRTLVVANDSTFDADIKLCDLTADEVQRVRDGTFNCVLTLATKPEALTGGMLAVAWCQGNRVMTVRIDNTPWYVFRSTGSGTVTLDIANKTAGYLYADVYTAELIYAAPPNGWQLRNRTFYLTIY